MVRFGAVLVSGVLLFLIGTGLYLWGTHILPTGPERFGFVVLIVAGCLAALFTIAREPRWMRTSYTRARPAQVPEQELVRVPDPANAGTCWQCGRPVSGKNTLCWRCGATQPVPKIVRPRIVPGQPSEWEQQSQPIYRVPEPTIPSTSSAPLYMPAGWDERIGESESDEITSSLSPEPPPSRMPSKQLMIRPGSQSVVAKSARFPRKAD